MSAMPDCSTLLKQSLSGGRVRCIGGCVAVIWKDDTTSGLSPVSGFHAQNGHTGQLGMICWAHSPAKAPLFHVAMWLEIRKD